MFWTAPLLAAACVFIQTASAAILQENFSSNPASHGWRVFGDTNLFAWDPAQKQLSATWDSSLPNTYFYHELGTVLGRDDDFSMAFDLELNDIGPGTNVNKSGAFGLAIGLLDLQQATNSAFLRGTGTGSPNLVEFDYFRDAGFGATIWPTFVSSNSVFNYNGTNDYTLLGLSTAVSYHVQMAYSASNSTLVTTMTQNGTPFSPIHSVTLATNFTDFRVNTFAISSYNDTGDDFDSLLAHGTVGNLVITTPPPPVSNLVGNTAPGNSWQVQFTGRTNWVYTLQRSADFRTWTNASAPLKGTGANQELQDPGARSGSSFYRLLAQKP